jgi:hypothetical protein
VAPSVLLRGRPRSGKVTSHKMSENSMYNRGSKSGFISKFLMRAIPLINAEKTNWNSVKVQRIDSSLYINHLMYIRYILGGFAKNHGLSIGFNQRYLNYSAKIPSKKYNLKKFSTSSNYSINPGV